MRSLVNGCAAAALMLGLASAAHAEIVVRDAPVHAVPAEDGQPAAADAAPDDDVAVVAPQKPPAPKVEAPKAELVRVSDETKSEPAAVQALMRPKPAPAALTPDENAFFDTLGQRVTDAASAYESYVRRVGAIDPAFTGSGSVQKAVVAADAYQPQQLEEGIVAYAALIALRNPAFVDGVRSVRDASFFDALVTAPDHVMRLPGAPEAAADAANVLRSQGEVLIASGKAITKAAYDIQAQSWSKTPVADPQGVLDGAKTSADQLRAATVPSKERLLASLVAAPPPPAGSAGSSAPDVVRGLALAALAITGRAGDGRDAAYDVLLHDAAGVDCLKMSKLNLNQCLAVAGPHYEDVYCVGRHAVSDTGKCVTEAAASGDAAALPPPAAQPRLEDTEGYGLERAEAYGQASPAAAGAGADSDAAQPAPAARYAAEAPPPAPAPRVQPPAQVYAQNDYAPAAQASAPYPSQQQYAQQSYPQPPQYAQPQYQQPQYQQPQYQQPQAYPQQPPYPAQAYPSQAYYQPYGYAARSYYYGR